MSQFVLNLIDHSTNAEVRSVETLLDSIIYQNEVILNKMSSKINEEVLRNYYIHYEQVAETKKMIENLKNLTH